MKNRPLFPNGYNKKKKVEAMPSKVKLTKNTERTLNILKNSYSNILSKLQGNMKVQSKIQSTIKLMKAENVNISLIHKQEIKLSKADDVVNAGKLVMENLYRRLEKWKENPPKLGYKLKEKNMQIFESWWAVNIKQSNGRWVYDDETKNKQMILQGLINRGYNMFDPVVVRDELKGMNPDDIYYVWISMHDEFEYYEAFFLHFEDTVNEILDIVSKPGFNIDEYIEKRKIQIKKKDRFK